MLSFDILLASNKDHCQQWDRLIGELSPAQRDIHYGSAFGRVQERLGCDSILAMLRTNEGIILQSFVLNEIPGQLGLHDMSSTGYGGPLTNIKNIPALVLASTEFYRLIASAQKGLVSSFCYFHPSMTCSQMAMVTKATDVQPYKSVVMIGLQEFGLHKVSRRVRRAMKRGGTVTELNASDATNRETFFHLYNMAMDKKNAAPHWRFHRSYLDAHFTELGAKLFAATDDAGLRELMVLGDKDGIAYAHLLGSNGCGDGLDEQLYFKTAMMLKDEGYSIFHLGGGLTTNADDKLLAFKAGFGEKFQMWCHRWVVDEKEYSRLSEQRENNEINEHGRISRSNYFPAYRRPFI